MKPKRSGNKNFTSYFTNQAHFPIKFIDAHIVWTIKNIGKPHDLLVLLDSCLTAFTSVAYQPSHLLGVFRGLRPGSLILRRVSHLDAFSAYPIRTWLLCDATGVTTDTPSVRSFRSSRTKNDTSQASCAHIG